MQRSITGAAMKLKEFNRFISDFEKTEKMPLLFLGHGNPMHAISENEFTRGWRESVKGLPTSKAILCISAHWETKGTFVTAMEKPQTLHDFGGFPQALFDVKYPAPGNPELAKQTQQIIKKTAVGLEFEWGLDHGCWSVIKHLYPKAEIPVIQMSLDYTKGPEWHYELSRELSALREKGVLIVGSGNIVHNLGLIDWQGKETFDWAIEANETVKGLVSKGDHIQLIRYKDLGKAVSMAIPTPDHYLPLLYILGLKSKGEEVTFFNDKIDMGSISMTSARIGKTAG
jgi:4,5-DOPA dioxygenase extradiol